MKKLTLAFLGTLLIFLVATNCVEPTTNTNNQSSQQSIQITGKYSGTDNVGMQSTIIIRSGGTLIIESSIGDGSSTYGKWTGTADNISLYLKDDFGNDEFIADAEVTKDGLRIKGGNFYRRQ